MDKKPIGYVKGQPNVMDKKIKANPKYNNIKKTLNTGITAKNIEVISNQLVAKRKGEQFRRIQHPQLVTLLEVDCNTESIYNMNDFNQLDDQSVLSHNTQLSTHTKTLKEQNTNLSEQSEFILVDTRETDQHNLYHILGSVNMPFTMMLQEKWNTQMKSFKNKEDKLIILYHLDEKNGIKMANHCFEKGYDNIYLLTGGVEEFTQEAHDLVQGTQVPPLLKKTKTDPKIQKRSNYKEPVNKILAGKETNNKDTMSELSSQFDRQSIQSKMSKLPKK